MKGLDLRNFKKIKDTDTHAIFRHENGSEIKVAKSGLSPKLRKDMDTLPVYRADGDPDGDDAVPDALKANDDSDQQSQGHAPINISINASPQPQQGQQSQQAPPQQDQSTGWKPGQPIPQGWHAGPENSIQKDTGEPGLVQKTGDWLKENYLGQGPRQVSQLLSQPPPSLSTTPAGNVASLGNPLSAVTPPDGSSQQTSAPVSQQQVPTATKAPSPMQSDFASIKQQHLNNYMDEIQKFANDLNTKQITPETYQQWFGKKDTLGKIGTVFGLMLGGMGSGLTHQPNAAMEMMNNEIGRDFDAQKANMTNKANFLNIASQGILNQAQASRLSTDQQIQAQTLAGIHATQAVIHSLSEKVRDKSLPIGSPQRAQAEQALFYLSQGAQNQITNAADKASTVQAMMHYMSGEAGPTMGGEFAPKGDVDFNRMNQLERASQFKLPGAPSSEDIQNMTKEAEHLQEARALRYDFNDAFNALDNDWLGGKFSPNQRQSYVNSLAGKLAKVSAGRYNEDEARNQIESMIPKANDWGNTRDVKRQNNNKFFDIEEAGTPTLSRFGLKLPPNVSHGTSADPMEGRTATNKPTGQQLIRRNGQWVPLGQ